MAQGKNKKKAPANNVRAVVKYKKPTADSIFRAPRNGNSDLLGRANSNVIISEVYNKKRARGGRGASNLPPILASYIDPWDETAIGARYPDQYHGMSGTFSSTIVGPIVTPTNNFTDLNMVGVTALAGTSLMCFTPDPSSPIIAGVAGTQLTAGGFFTTVPGIFHWPNGILFTNAAGSKNAYAATQGIANLDTAIPNIAPLREMYSAARLVSGGVKIHSTQNFSTVSGTIHMAPVFVSYQQMTTNGLLTTSNQNVPVGEMSNGWQTVLPSSLPGLAQLNGYVQYPMSALETGEIAAIFKRYGEEAVQFKPTATQWGTSDGNTGNLVNRFGSSTNPNSTGHYYIVMYIEGALSSTGGALPALTQLGEIEVRLNYECQPNPSSAIMASNSNTGQMGIGQVSQAPPYQPLLAAAIDNLAMAVPALRCIDTTGIEEERFVKEVSSLWSNAVSVASSVASAVSVISPFLSALVL